MMVDGIRSAKVYVEDSLRNIDSEVARLDEEKQLIQNKLNELNQRKAAFIDTKNNLLADKSKLEVEK